MANEGHLAVEVQLTNVGNASTAGAHVRLRTGGGVMDHVSLTPLAAEQLANSLLDAAKRVRAARAAFGGSRSSSTPKASS